MQAFNYTPLVGVVLSTAAANDGMTWPAVADRNAQQTLVADTMTYWMTVVCTALGGLASFTYEVDDEPDEDWFICPCDDPDCAA